MYGAFPIAYVAFGLFVFSVVCVWLFSKLHFLIKASYIQVDCDKTIMVTLKHDEKLQDGSECAFQVHCHCISLSLFLLFIYFYSDAISLTKFHCGVLFFWHFKKIHLLANIAGLGALWILFHDVQCALLYTTIDGQRRIRVSTLSLPCTTMLSNLFRSADLDTQFACILKQGKSVNITSFCRIILFISSYFPYPPPCPKTTIECFF